MWKTGIEEPKEGQKVNNCEETGLTTTGLSCLGLGLVVDSTAKEGGGNRVFYTSSDSAVVPFVEVALQGSSSGPKQQISIVSSSQEIFQSHKY